MTDENNNIVYKQRPKTKCNGCGKEYTPRTKRYSSYCSRECAFKYIKQWQSTAGRGEQLDKPSRYCNVFFKACSYCAKSFATRLFKTESCSKDCAYKHNLSQARKKYKAKDKEMRSCSTCSEDFYTNRRSAKYCSPKCVPRRSSVRARARHAGVYYEPVNALRVLNRDGWRCQICGKATPVNRRGTRYSNAPEIDHRVPFSLGGPHTYANVQCSCRACNASKGGVIVVGQLPLFALQ